MQRHGWAGWVARAIAVAAGWTVLLGLLGQLGTGAAGTRVASGQRFLDSVGVQTHSTFFDTAYADTDAVIRAVTGLGIRHVRDGVRTGPRNAVAVRALARLGRTGVRLNLGPDVPLGDVAGLDEALGIIRASLLPYTESIEGPNELDAIAGPDWVARTRTQQRELFTRVKRDPALRRLPVLAPSLADNGNQAALGSLRGLADWANLHSYPGGLPPSRGELGAELLAAREAVPGAPLAITETGYHNALAEHGRQPPTSERAAAAYYPRLFLEAFSARVRRTYAYELVDEKPEPGRIDQEQHFGLFRNDFSPKPAAESVRRLLALVRGPEPGDRGDGGDSGGPRSLDLDVRAPAPVRRLVLRRSDGRLLVLLWQTAMVWDREARRDLERPPVRARVRLGATFGSVALHRVGAGPGAARARDLGAARAVTVSVPADEVVGLVLGPAAGGLPLPLVRPPRPRRRAPPEPPRAEPAGRREDDADRDLDPL
jgi:hypothetical protein